MDNITPIFITGIAIFGGAAVLIAAAHIYFVRKQREVAAKYKGDEWRVKWANTEYIYETAFNGCIGFLVLYLLQYFGQGLAIKPNLLIIVWERWLFYGFVGTVYMGILNYVMTKKPHGAQSLFSLLIYGVSIFSILAATLSQTEDRRIVWIVFSLFCFAYSISRIFWPHNRIWTEEYRRVRDVNYSKTPLWRVLFGFVKEDTHSASIVVWAFSYRFVLLINICLSYAGMIITWFVSDGNEFTDAADLQSTLISYLIFDFIFLIPFTVLFSGLTFANKTARVSASKQDGSLKRLDSNNDSIYAPTI